MPIGSFAKRQTLELLLKRPKEQQQLTFPLAGGHVLYMLSSSRRPKTFYVPGPSEEFPDDTCVICVCGYCTYSAGKYPTRSKVLLNVWQLGTVYKLFSRMKRLSFVKDFYDNKVLRLKSVQRVGAVDAVKPAYWNDVSLYPHFVWYRTVRKIESIMEEKSSKNGRLSIIRYMNVLKRLEQQDLMKDFAMPIIPAEWQRRKAASVVGRFVFFCICNIQDYYPPSCSIFVILFNNQFYVLFHIQYVHCSLQYTDKG